MLIEWIKKNKFLTIVLLILAYLTLQILKPLFRINTLNLNIPTDRGKVDITNTQEFKPSAGGATSSQFSLKPAYEQGNYTPQPNIKDRLVIQESTISLLVKDVFDSRNRIVKYAQDSGGYMVSSNISNPQDAPWASVTVRIPATKLEDALTFLRGLAVKVVSENLVGEDVTDQYVDIEKRINQLERTKARLEEILSQATQVSDITNITQQILNYQNQIDSFKGQQEALKKNAELAKLTIYLSTDEIALPYTPSETFRPKVIFKLAVRSLIGTLRKLATIAIWVLVYSVIWVPALAIYLGIRRWLKARKIGQKSSV